MINDSSNNIDTIKLIFGLFGLVIGTCIQQLVIWGVLNFYERIKRIEKCLNFDELEMGLLREQTDPQDF